MKTGRPQKNQAACDTLAARLTQRMTDKQLSKTQLAKHCEVSTSTVTRWTLAQAYPTPNRIRQLCQILQCSVTELTGEPICDTTTSAGK